MGVPRLFCAGLCLVGLPSPDGRAAGPAAPPVPSEMTLRVVPEETAAAFGAACLDGSPPSMYIRAAADATEWVLFLEGGGWCFGSTPEETLASCAARAKTAGGSSAYNAPTAPDYGGVFSGDPSLNPRFAHFNMAFLKYCDGSSFGGGAALPAQFNGSLIHFRGRANFDALISDLQANYGLDRATEVILSGGSAGGLAVFYNLDHLAELLGPAVLLTGFPDAGFFIDAKVSALGPSVEGRDGYWYRQQFIGADSAWNVTSSHGTNAACLAATSPAKRWQCLMAEYIAPHLRTPIFIMNSAYDGYQLPEILKTLCHIGSVDVTSCSSAELDEIQEYHSKLQAKVLDAVRSNLAREPSGCYVDSCWVHEQNLDYCSGQSSPNCVGWSPAAPGSKRWGYTTSVFFRPMQVQLTPEQAFSAYYDSRLRNRLPAKCNATEVKSCWAIIDETAFPSNPSCVYRTTPVQFQQLWV